MLSEVVVGAHFVFNGPNQPMPKPGKEVKVAPLLLVQHFQDMLTAFGFSWHVVGHTNLVFLLPVMTVCHRRQVLRMQSLPN